MKNIATTGLIVMLFLGLNGFSNVNTAIHTDRKNSKVITDGAILGSVIAPNFGICISATDGTYTFGGATNSKGEFFINGFHEGIYDVTITATDEKKTLVTTFEDVPIRIGEVTALGTVNFDE